MEFRKKYTIPCISEDDNDIKHASDPGHLPTSSSLSQKT
jgi:hypothetical protein